MESQKKLNNLSEQINYLLYELKILWGLGPIPMMFAILLK